MELDAFKIIILLLFVGVIVALGTGFTSLTGKPSVAKSQRMARALTVRVAISAVILALLVLALATGMITPNADPSRQPPPTQNAG